MADLVTVWSRHIPERIGVSPLQNTASRTVLRPHRPRKASFPRKALLALSKAAGLFVFLHFYFNTLIHEPDRSILNRTG